LINESYIQNIFAERIGGAKFGKDTTIYKFEKIKRSKASAIDANPGVELIDMGVGEPDEMAFPEVVSALQSEATKPENRGYSDNGVYEFKLAASIYLETIFGVPDIDPDREINHCIGAKSALAMLPLAFINHGDLTGQTVPGYPVMATHTKYLGGGVVNLPLTPENRFLPDLSSIREKDLIKMKLLYINYPNNPTGARATPEFYDKVVRFASDNNVVVVQDAAYAALTYETKPYSFLSVDGAKNVGVELHSLSKSHNMTGWRLGFVAGNKLVVNAFANIKDNIDSGQFIGIQKAGITGLDNLSITEQIRHKYERRLKLLVNALKTAGFEASMPSGTFYLYVKAPKGIEDGQVFSSGEDFSQWMIKEKLISTVPWDDAGSFVRFSVTFSAKNEVEEGKVMDEIAKRLSDVKFRF
jgi:LL-diaminopimelate aminotransferase|tara:strand:- start:58559 stop:59797 length:1239 start_codon:yes stop_codon:yes gene_type:complete